MSIISSVLNLFPRFSGKQTDSSKNQVQPIIEASNTEASNNGNKDLNISTNTTANVDISDVEDISSDAVHHEMCDNQFLHKNLFQDIVRNEMLTLYNRILIGPFKEFFQSVSTNNLAEVLQALKEVNFMLTNRAPELTAPYNMPLEPCQITDEEVPNLV